MYWEESFEETALLAAETSCPPRPDPPPAAFHCASSTDPLLKLPQQQQPHLREDALRERADALQRAHLQQQQQLEEQRASLLKEKESLQLQYSQSERSLHEAMRSEQEKLQQAQGQLESTRHQLEQFATLQEGEKAHITETRAQLEQRAQLLENQESQARDNLLRCQEKLASEQKMLKDQAALQAAGKLDLERQQLAVEQKMKELHIHEQNVMSQYADSEELGGNFPFFKSTTLNESARKKRRHREDTDVSPLNQVVSSMNDSSGDHPTLPIERSTSSCIQPQGIPSSSSSNVAWQKVAQKLRNPTSPSERDSVLRELGADGDSDDDLSINTGSSNLSINSGLQEDGSVGDKDATLPEKAVS